MIRIIRIILIGILSVAVLVSAVGLLLPDKTVISRSTEINRTSDIPFQLVNDLTKWKEWSPWFAMDTSVILTYSNPAEGSGAFYTWDSKNSDVGKGKLIIKESKPFSQLEMELIFDEWGSSYVLFDFEDMNDSVCRVTWQMTSVHGWNVFSRWFGLFMDNMIGPDFESGLAALADVSEKKPRSLSVGGFDAEIRDLTAQQVLGIRYQIPQSAVTPDLFAQGFTSLNSAVIRANIEPTGMPTALYYSLSPQKLDFEMCIPVNALQSPDKHMVLHELAPTRALVLTYKGPYDAMNPAYEAVYGYLSANGLVMQKNMPIREIYITDPELEKDTANWITEIVFPIE